MQMPGMDGVQFLGRTQPGSEHHASVDRGKDGYRLPGQMPSTRWGGDEFIAIVHHNVRRKVPLRVFATSSKACSLVA